MFTRQQNWFHKRKISTMYLSFICEIESPYCFQSNDICHVPADHKIVENETLNMYLTYY